MQYLLLTFRKSVQTVVLRR